PHDPGRAAPAPDERCRRPRHRPDRADRPGRPARPRPCRQASATLCVAEDSDRRASRPSSGVVLSVSEPIPPTGGWCTSCPCRTASTCGCTCATTHRDSMIFQAKISTTISHYFAEPRAAFQLPQAISKACHGPHLPHRQKSPLKNGSWARVRSAKGAPPKFKKTTDPETNRRRRSTANRTLTVLKAALNFAWKGKHGPAPWRDVKPYASVDTARVRYLSIDEARRLINAGPPAFRALVRAALATGCRYGELAALNVGDFSRDSSTLHIRTSKSGKGRHVALAEEGVELFEGLAAGRLSTEPMLARSDGTRWLSSHQGRPMAEACRNGSVEPPANFHALRHTYASHAIMNGAPLFVVARNLGHSTTAMVEKHYGHLAPSYIADAIRAAAPRFGYEEPGRVAPLRGTDRRV